MRANELQPFEEIAHSDSLLRLEWFNGVHGNLDEYDNPLIECIFTPFDDPNPSNGKTSPKPRIKNQFIAGIAAGYLPIQFIGKFFRSGKSAPLEEWPPAERIIFDLDVSNPAAVTECNLPDLQIDQKADFITHRFKRFANPAGLKKLRGTLQSTTNDKIKIIPASQIVVIHEIELVRYYLTNSTHSCKNIFTGAFTKKNIERRVVNTIHEPVTFDPQIGRGRFVYKHGYTKDDAPILGRILFDQSALTLNAAQRVQSKILADHINAESRPIGYPRTFFPFTGKTQLELSGRRIKTTNGFIFLAYRIHSCTSSFPYKILSFCDEISHGGAPAPEDAPVAFANQKPPEIGPVHDDNNPFGVSTSHEQPSSASLQLKKELSSRRYPGLDNVELIKEKLRDSTYRSEKKVIRYLDSLINASTGGGTSGASSAARQSIAERIAAPSSLTPDLDTFIKVIKGLRTLHPDWNIDTIIVGAGAIFNGEKLSEFPAVPCQKRKETMRQFSYIDTAKQIHRRFICTQVNVHGQYVYLFEAERRLREKPPPIGSKQSPYKEEMSVLLLRSPGHKEIEGDDFLPAIRQTVINTTWPIESKLNGYIRDHTVHGLGLQSSDEMCARVAQLIQQNLAT